MQIYGKKTLANWQMATDSSWQHNSSAEDSTYEGKRDNGEGAQNRQVTNRVYPAGKETDARAQVKLGASQSCYLVYFNIYYLIAVPRVPGGGRHQYRALIPHRGAAVS